MDAIMEMAQKLGKAISESPQASKLRQAREELDKQQNVVQLLKDYQAQTDKVAKLEEEKKPVEVEDKHKLQELHDKLIASEAFKKLTSAQVEYIDLMRKVNATLQKHLAGVER